MNMDEHEQMVSNAHEEHMEELQGWLSRATARQVKLAEQMVRSRSEQIIRDAQAVIDEMKQTAAKPARKQRVQRKARVQVVANDAVEVAS